MERQSSEEGPEAGDTDGAGVEGKGVFPVTFSVSCESTLDGSGERSPSLSGTSRIESPLSPVGRTLRDGVSAAGRG